MQAWFFMAYGVMGLGCLLVLFGLLGRRNWNRKLEKERALAAGRVVGYAQRTAGQRGSPVCQPIIAFTVDGEEHRANWNAIVPLSQWPVGKEVDLLYDPEHPEEFHLSEQEGESPPFSVMRGGAILIALALTAVIALRLLSGGGLLPEKGRDDGLPRVSVFNGDPDRAKRGFSYTLNQDGTATITGYNGSESELILPMMIDGQLVTAIGQSAFAANQTLASVTVPGTIRIIPAGAFAGCLSLHTFNPLRGVQRIESLAFTGCLSLKDVYLPESVTDIADDAFPKDCGATFYAAKGSETAKWCEKRGYAVKAE